MNLPLLRHILVPLDGSPHAETVLPLLRRLVPPGGSSWTLVQAVPFFDDDGAGEAVDYLGRLARQLTMEGFPSTFVVRWGSPAGVLREVSTETQATLIALATHGRTGLDRWAVGSVAEDVLQTSLLPVLLARSFAPSPAAPLRNLLLPLDQDPGDLDALEPMIGLARGSDVRVRLLEVADPAGPPVRWETPGPSARIADQVLREACIPTTFEQRRGKPSEEILKSAVEHEADLIAMTTHGRHGPPRLFLGSVTAEVLRRTPVPLLAVRRGAKKTAGPAEIPAMPAVATPVPAAGTALARTPS